MNDNTCSAPVKYFACRDLLYFWMHFPAENDKRPKIFSVRSSAFVNEVLVWPSVCLHVLKINQWGTDYLSLWLKPDFFNLRLMLPKFIAEIFHLSQSFTHNGIFSLVVCIHIWKSRIVTELRFNFTTIHNYLLIDE